MPDRRAYQHIFEQANSRLHDLSDDGCRDLEIAQTRALRVIGPRPEMLRTLVRTMKEEPAGPAFKQRAHHTMRRLFKACFDADLRAETFQTAINAYLDGQTELAAKWLTIDVLLRPWGEH
ncbi:MAG: hypothetical protein KC912_05840 [Proteobacteria bacterium]|nr:hypothetical protein [Pseudomonadota bacterium]